MKKTDKKLENKICGALTLVCEAAKFEITGFRWLTHIVDYNHFPDSLLIVCVFDTNAALVNARKIMKDQYFSSLINEHFKSIELSLKNIEHHITYDTEEACGLENNHQWNERFKSSKHYKVTKH